MMLILKSTQNLGVTIECKRERFGRGSLGTDPKEASPLVWSSPSSERRKAMKAREELSVPLFGLLCSWCRARADL
jgi:hypothetical protein